jgi:hypothetical protein
LVDVKVNVTVPAAISPALGTYVAFRTADEGLKLPLPEVVQFPVLAPPVTLPVSATDPVAQIN